MKKFSKESMQNFMLLHAEKLILGGCIAATGFLVWTSMSGEEGLTKSPSDLLSEAKSAETYINKDTWEQLEPFRQGEAEAREKIEKAKRIDPDNYSLTILGTVAPSMAPRQDPLIIAPEQMIGTRVNTGVLMDLAGVTSPLTAFNEAPARAEDAGNGFKVGGGGGGDFESGGFEAGGGGFGGSGLPEDFPSLDRSGVLSELYALTMPGIRPQAFGVNADRTTTNVLDVVCVTAVVDYQKQLAAFETAFGQSVAFNAKRDRPVYQSLQVQRREVSDKESEWQDITEKVTYEYPSRYPKAMVKMPLQIFSSAPEVIAHENYDPILSQVIPAFVMLDYQQLASHPALKQRREFPEWQGRKKKDMMGRNDSEVIPGFGARRDVEDDEAISGGAGEEGAVNELRKGSSTDAYKEAIALRKPGGQYRLVRFFDYFSPSEKSRSKTYEYRTRVWVGDPNQIDPADGFRKNRGRRLEAGEDGEVKFAAGTGGESDLDMSGMEDLENKEEMEGGGVKEVVQVVNMSMLAPPVRKRINAATNLDVVQERFEEAARSGTPVEPLEVAEFSEAGELELVKLPPSTVNYAYTQYLRFARPSAWSEPVRVKGTQSPADVYAGPTVRDRPITMDLGNGVVEFDKSEPYIEVVVSSWVRSLGTKLPSKKRVHVGETLDFNSPAYVIHPVTWQVLVAENPDSTFDDETLKRFTLDFRTGETVVDAFTGQQLELPNNKKLMMELPTEVLTVDASGNLKVSNQFDSATGYRNEIAEQDSSRFYGRPRKSSKKKVDDPGEFGDEDF